MCVYVCACVYDVCVGMCVRVHVHVFVCACTVCVCVCVIILTSYTGGTP